MTQDHDNRGSRKGTGSMIAGIILGGIAGAAAAFLLAPQSGSETRRLFQDKGMELKNRALMTAEETRLRAERTLSESRVQAEGAIHDVRNKAEEAVRQARQSAAEITRKAEQKLAPDEDHAQNQ